MKAFVSGRPYWWQWFTILSLDATFAALSWQAMAFRVAGTPLRWPHAVVLGASVWLAYAADRWIEGWRLTPEQAQTQRHYFAVRWRWPLFAVWLLVLALDLFAAFAGLTSREFEAGLLLFGAVAVYLLSHQLLHRHHPWRLPKEICVALLMVGGVTIFPVAQPDVRPPALAGLATGFGLLCFANCALIALWEHEVDLAQGQESLAQQFGRVAPLSRALPWALALAALGSATWLTRGWNQRAMLCVSSSSALLGVVDRLEKRMGRQLARVLADVVLLTPLVLLAFH